MAGKKGKAPKASKVATSTKGGSGGMGPSMMPGMDDVMRKHGIGKMPMPNMPKGMGGR